MLILVFTIIINFWILRVNRSRVISKIDELPANEIGLVLGAVPRDKKGNIKHLFRIRVEDAAQLYHCGKVKHLIMSGRGNHMGLDEPGEMKDLAVELGVPESAITLDRYSFRTLDSIVRAKEVYGLTKFTIITNDFHTCRALFLSEYYGIDSVAYHSIKTPYSISRANLIREWLARVKAVLDVYILRTRPKLLGPRIEINRIRQI